MMTKNRSDGLTEANRFIQMGRYERMIFRRIVLCLHEGWRKSDAECNFLVGVYGCIRSERYWVDLPERGLKQMVVVLCWIRCVTGSQCRLWRIGWIWSDFLALHTSRAAAFWIYWSLSSRYWGQPESREVQWSKRERTREPTRVWVAGVVRWCRRELMCLICIYAVLQVLFMNCDMLRFESRVTLKFFHRGHKWDISISDVNDRR